MISDKCTQACNHLSDKDIEYFYHSTKSSCAPFYLIFAQIQDNHYADFYHHRVILHLL